MPQTPNLLNTPDHHPNAGHIQVCEQVFRLKRTAGASMFQGTYDSAALGAIQHNSVTISLVEVRTWCPGCRCTQGSQLLPGGQQRFGCTQIPHCRRPLHVSTLDDGDQLHAWALVLLALLDDGICPALMCTAAAPANWYTTRCSKSKLATLQHSLRACRSRGGERCRCWRLAQCPRMTLRTV